MASKSAVLLILLSITEFIIVSWSTLWPLRSELAVLGRASGWWRLYSFALGNLDVLSLALIRTCTAVVAVQSCPAAQRASDGGPTPLVPEASSNHDMVRHALSGLYGVYASFLLVKAAAVAVTAPADLWPDPTARPVEVGLVYLYGSIVTSLIATLLGSWLARRWVADREAAWEAAVDADDEEGGGGGSATDEQSSSLRAPLLRGNPSGSAASPAGGKGGGTRGQGGGVKSRRAAAKSQQRTISALLRLTIPDLPLMAVAFSAGIVAALGSAMLPYLTGQIIDFASIEPDRSKFRHTLVQLLLVAACTGIFTGTRGGLFTIVITRLNVRLRRTLFHSLLQQEVGFFDTTKTGEITSRLSADTSTVADQIGLNMNVMLRSATSASMVLFFMFAASWRLTVVTFILIPVVLAINQVYGKIYARMSKRVQEELAGANGVAEEVLSSMTTVKAHAAQDSAEAAYLAKLNGFYRLQLFEAAMYSVYAVLNTFLPNLVAAVVLFYGGSLVLGGQMSPGSLVSFMLYQQSLSGSFQLMGDVFTALTAAVGAAEKVVELMRRVPAVPPAGGLVLPALSGRVELERVVLHYPARPHVRVLDGLSLVAQPGEVVALVGASGGGKSSIVKLLQRFYLPSEGRVLIDGHEIGAFDPKWLRRQVALVSQEPVLYGRSIRRNIVFGLEQEDGCAAAPTQEDVEEAARMANAHEFITTFPEGYDTGCGEKGVTLSGGQKQRIAIARALVRRPRVLLLDEATSALDADSEAVVQEALDRVMSGRTVVVVAHRLSTIQGAHRIYVVGRGTVQETGTHDELLAAGGVYAQLVRRQLTRPGSQANLLHGSVSTASLLGQGTDDILPGSSSTPYRSD